ncbi:hypothetical protein GTY75_09045 [Streptomyces sp. SID8381]|uniref:hypothetical protein n=1 Tax=unclassified Streptomyces TaxID=2593676 RepID=UPI00039D381F|nr:MULTISPECIES: hypothetical protein [unclassified Streptomyces]MYX26813.1 hypothetical protein [Streptomyces sp. SID8381]
MFRPSYDNRPAPSFLFGVFLLITLFLGAVVLTGCATGDDGHTQRRCTTYASKSGDFVPAGPRPCVLYGSGRGTARSGDDDTVVRPAAPKPAGRPQAPAAKVPPAPKAPSAPKAPAAPPRVSLSKR